MVVTGALQVALQAGELELKPETLGTWNAYVHKATVAMEQRGHGSGPFLMMEENADRMVRVRAGEVVVWQVNDVTPRRIASGLIHDWMGAAFIPNVHIDDLLSVVRNYSRYKEVYRPGVLDAKLLNQAGEKDKFALVLKNGSYFTKTALDAEYESSYIRVDDSRWYTVSCSTRVQEIQNYKQEGEHELPPDVGHGYIWRMCSLSQLEERDGGVYVDEEMMALSRDVPAAMRWMAGPIIRRVAKETLATSIEKTRAAVGTRANTTTVASKRPATSNGGMSTSAICERAAVGCLR